MILPILLAILGPFNILPPTPTKSITNRISLTWSNPVPPLSNRITQIKLASTNEWWVSATNRFDLTLVRNFTEPRAKFTVALTYGYLSDESIPAFWPLLPKTNVVVEFFVVFPSTNQALIWSRTNPPGNMFMRLKYDQAVSVWRSQSSPNLLLWTNAGAMIVAPPNSSLRLISSDWWF